MSKISLHIGHGTMTCDYDHDHFNQEQKYQHSRESGLCHGKWSW